jgi:hypothetical protein
VSDKRATRVEALGEDLGSYEDAALACLTQLWRLLIMKTYATLLAGILGAMTFALPAVAADDAVKASMKQADSSYDVAKKQAKADEKSALAQCDTKSGDAKSQCKKDAEATYKKTMADAEAAHDKAKADYKAKK